MKQIGKVRAAPAASRARTKTLAQLGNVAGALNSQEVEHLPFRDVKAEAKLVVVFHNAPRTEMATAQRWA